MTRLPTGVAANDGCAAVRPRERSAPEPETAVSRGVRDRRWRAWPRRARCQPRRGDGQRLSTRRASTPQPGTALGRPRPATGAAPGDTSGPTRAPHTAAVNIPAASTAVPVTAGPATRAQVMARPVMAVPGRVTPGRAGLVYRGGGDNSGGYRSAGYNSGAYPSGSDSSGGYSRAGYGDGGEAHGSGAYGSGRVSAGRPGRRTAGEPAGCPAMTMCCRRGGGRAPEVIRPSRASAPAGSGRRGTGYPAPRRRGAAYPGAPGLPGVRRLLRRVLPVRRIPAGLVPVRCWRARPGLVQSGDSRPDGLVLPVQPRSL